MKDIYCIKLLSAKPKENTKASNLCIVAGLYCILKNFSYVSTGPNFLAVTEYAAPKFDIIAG